VATEFAASWNPLLKSKSKARAMIAMTAKSSGSTPVLGVRGLVARELRRNGRRRGRPHGDDQVNGR
jgi:hypothetical protein